jgi:transcriptional regulator with PAS, ATPase and Fis domain
MAETLPMALSLLETMPGGALLYDPAGRILGINASARRIFRVKARDVLGNPITILYGDSQWQNVTRTGMPSSAQKFCVDDATFVRMELPVFADGRVVAILAHFLSRDTGLLREILPKLPGTDSRTKAQDEEPLPIAEPPRVERSRFSISDIKGSSRAIRDARVLANRAAQTDMPVVIQGEPGTEVEGFAKAIHQASARSATPMIVVDCHSASESLLESELFGGGAGGPDGRQGALQSAEGGTLLLEGVGELPLRLQERLDQAMRDSLVMSGGSTSYRVRFMASTQQDLIALVGQGRFREDLYYRLNVIRLEIPPLRTRPEDVRALVDHHLSRLNQLYANQGWNKHVTSDAFEVLLRYSWPGNVAELESVLERAYVLSDREDIAASHLPLALQHIGRVPTEAVGRKTLDEIVAEVERGVIIEALRVSGQNRSRTAKLLGLPRSSFYEKLARYGLMADRDE